MSEKAVKPAPAGGDEYAGKGGSYVVNPESGQRALVARTAPEVQPTEKEADDGSAQA